MIGSAVDLLPVAAPLAGAAYRGLYLAFDLAVLPALDRRSGAAAGLMREINVAIVRPGFLTLLVGAPALAVAAAVTHPSWPTIGAAVLQAGALVVTMAVNVPLNERLARDTDGGAWSRFIGPWRRAHRLRTACALGAAALGCAALL